MNVNAAERDANVFGPILKQNFGYSHATQLAGSVVFMLTGQSLPIVWKMLWMRVKRQLLREDIFTLH